MAIKLGNATLIKGLTDYANPQATDYSDLTSNWSQNITDNMAIGNTNVPIDTNTMAKNAMSFQQQNAMDTANALAQAEQMQQQQTAALTPGPLDPRTVRKNALVAASPTNVLSGGLALTKDLRDQAKQVREGLRGKTLSTLIKFFLGDWAGAAAGAASGSQAVGAAVKGAIQGGAKGALTGGLNAAFPNSSIVQAGTSILNGGLGNYLLQNANNYVSNGFNFGRNYGNRNYIGRNYLQNIRR